MRVDPEPETSEPAASRARRALQRVQYGLIGLGVLLLGYTSWVAVDAHRFQQRASGQLDSLIEQRRASTATLPDDLHRGDGAATAASLRTEDGYEVLGRIEVPRVGIEAVVVEGAEGPALQRAVGHITGTALPGEEGNVGLAAHRDTYFGALRYVQPGDVVRLVTPRGTHEYSVALTMVVEPSDSHVLETYRVPVVTLVTCYPFDHVGSAPQRFIVQAYRLEGTDAGT